jgi:hypothetical protein
MFDFREGKGNVLFVLSFSALADAATDSAFHFMRGADTLVSLLDSDGHPYAVADAVPTPCTSYTGFDGT